MTQFLMKINSWGRILSIEGLVILFTAGYPAPLIHKARGGTKQ